MIRLERLSKAYRIDGRRRVVAEALDAVFPTGRAVALLGRNGAGKSSLLRIIAGTLAPDSGRVVSDGTVSWPVGFAGAFHPDLSGAQNVRFIARIYGVDTAALCDFVAEFAELGRQFHQPFRSYSSGMRARLAFGASMGIRFDTYLVDEVTAVGDAAFKARSEALLRDRLAGASAIVVSHFPAMLRRICDAGAVLECGRITYYDDLEEALARHAEDMRRPPVPA